MKKILVIDDDPSMLRLAFVTLNARGFEVMTATNGREGLRVARSFHPDLIVMDVVMPEMDGIALLDMLKHNSVTARIPVLAMSSLMGDGQMPASFDRHCVGFVEKPIEMNHLVNEINYALAK